MTDTVVVVSEAAPGVLEVISAGPQGPQGPQGVKGDVGDVNPAMNTILADAQTARNQAQTAATSAQTSATAAGTAQTAAETAKTGAETARTGAETARTGAETAQTAAAGSASSALSSATTATQKATDATNAATSASLSATNATTQAGVATTKASEAVTSASNAASSASAALASKNAAATSETNAATSAATATTKATEAGTSANAAAASASAAAASATTAGTKATDAATSASQAAATAATIGTAANTAAAQAAIATSKATDATNAATAAANSATAAASSATTATNWGTSAQTSANTATTKAAEAFTSAANAASSASAAATSANTATTQANLAITSASNAATSEANAATTAAGLAASVTASQNAAAASATQAANSATASANSATQSASWATASANSATSSASGAATSTAKASEAAASAAAIQATFGNAASVAALAQTAAAQASLAQGYAASAASVVSQDLSGVTAQALHRSPNAISSMFIYDTSKDSDGGAWTEKCQHTSWYNEPLMGKWLGAHSSEYNARFLGAPTLGSEMVVNGSFATDTAWTKGTGWTIANGVATVVGSGTNSGYLEQTFVTVVGKLYRIEYTISGYSGGAGAWIAQKNNPAAWSSLQNTGYNGTQVLTFVAAVTSTTFGFFSSGTGSFSIDNVSIREITALNTASGDYFQLTTDGKFYRLNKNLLAYSELFSDGIWTKTGSSISGKKLVATNGTSLNSSFVAQNVTKLSATATTYTFTADVTSAEYNRALLLVRDGLVAANYVQVSISLIDGSTVIAPTTVGAFSAATVAVVNISPGRYSIRLTFTSSTETSLIARIYPRDSVATVGDGASGITLNSVQLEAASSFTGYEAKSAGQGISEIFRGNKADFPRLAGIVAEAGNVNIYDLTEPGRPMWMRFFGGNSSCVVRGNNLTCITSFGGFLYIGHGTSFGLAKVDFVNDKATLITTSGEFLPRNISNRNDTSFVFSTATNTAQGPSVVNAAINALAMTVLPDAPIDPATGLRVPTIAVATGGGVSVIKHNGTVVNSASSSGFTTIVLNPSYLMVTNANDTRAWYSGPVGALGASFSMLQYQSNPSIVDWVRNAGAGSGAFQHKATRNMIMKRTGYSVQLGRMHEADFAKSIFNCITPTFNTGWMIGDIRRCFLSDATVESVIGTELVVAGAAPWSRGFLSVDGTISASGSSVTITQGAGDGNSMRWVQPVTCVIGRYYRISVASLSRSGGTGLTVGLSSNSAGTGLSVGVNAFTDSTNLAATILATATTMYVTVSLSGGTTGNTATFNSLSLIAADQDRSYKAQGAAITGTLTKAALATGTSLVGYSDFSAANYLREPYSADLDFGTGEWTASAWVNIPATLPDTSFPLIGSELVTNGGFDTDTAWAKGTGWTISDGVATKVAGTVAGITQNIGLVKDRVYEVKLTVNVTAGNLIIRLGDSTPNLVLISTSGTYTYRLPASGPAGNGIVYFNGDAAFAGTVDSVSVREVGVSTILDRAHSTGARIRLGLMQTGRLTAETFDGTTTRAVTTSAAYNTAQWLKVRVNYTTDGTLAILVNGRELAATRGTPLLTLNNSSAVLTIGNSYALDAPFPGSIALLKLGATIPTPEQGQFMYEQEKQLFRAGAQSVLPDATSIVDMAYDDATDRWVAASASNESYWTGLVRNAVTAVPAGSYTRVAAGSGLELVARSTTNPGVDVTIPAYGLREELVRRSEAAARLTKELAIYDYVGGFTANTTNGSTAITSASTITYPGSYIGARISGTGIPANTTIVAVSGTTLYLSAAATATANGVSISFLDFELPVGMEAKTVLSAGAVKQEGATKDYTRLYDGFIETIRFGVAPGATAWVQIQAQRITLQ